MQLCEAVPGDDEEVVEPKARPTSNAAYESARRTSLTVFVPDSGYLDTDGTRPGETHRRSKQHITYT
jgi:hypothetical protein